MTGKKSGVSTQIPAIKQPAVAIHCQGDFLSLSVKSMTKECDILHDIMSVVGKICILVKFSPKRENLLGNIDSNIEREDSEMFETLKKLSTMRWTVPAECMKRVIDNYESLLQLWEEYLEEKLDQETKARIVGCKSQMESFYFFFGINLSYKLFAMTDNLRKTLQLTKMPAIKGKKYADLVANTLKSMRKDDDFDSFFEVVKKAANFIEPVGNPTLPRKRKRPNYSILEYVTGYERSREQCISSRNSPRLFQANVLSSS